MKAPSHPLFGAQVIFTDPMYAASGNRHTSPQLDAEVAALHSDDDLKLAVFHLKRKFIEHKEALLHGDLHTGSFMTTDCEQSRSQTRCRGPLQPHGAPLMPGSRPARGSAL